MDRSFSSILNASNAGFAPMIQNQGPIRVHTGAVGEAGTLSDRGLNASSSRKRPASRIKSSYPRKRAIQACQKCRARRTKCNNSRPACSACLDLGVQCTYSEGDPSSFDAASLAILEKLNTIEQLLRNDHDASQAINSRFGDNIDIQSPLSHVKSLNSPTLERTRDVPCHMNIENVLSWPVFDDQTPNLDLKGLLNATDTSKLQSVSVIADFEQMPEETLVQRFMDQVFIFNPVLEEAKLQRYLRDARYNGLGWDAQSCLLLLIYAHGSLVRTADPSQSPDASTFRQSSQFKQAENFFTAAQKRMGLLLCCSGITEAQCFFLAGVYLMATIRPLEAWKMFVQALACCQAFYSTRMAPNVDADGDRRLRESIYWTCFKSELELRLELNVSETSVWDLTYPAFFPSPPEGLKSQREIVWYFYLAEIALRRLGNRILNYIYDSKATDPNSTSSTDMVDSIVGFEQQASDWIRSLPKGLGLSDPLSIGSGSIVDESELHTTLKFILNGHLLDCYEMMYWPFVAEAINNTRPHSIVTPASNATSPAACDLSLTQKALLVCVQRIRKNEPGFFYRHHGTWLMLRSCTRSGLVLLAASRASERVKATMPKGWKEAVGKVVEMLRFWRRESKDVEDRLRLVERLWRTA